MGGRNELRRFMGLRGWTDQANNPANLPRGNLRVPWQAEWE